ncbi:MAG: PspC domain-containing protein [Gammaproteobacteria bacterium]|nr:PspC domain-containing protein [Gammaproteobacteria bacterium]
MIAGRRYYSTTDSPRRFRCRQGGVIIMGVCAGVADFFSLDRTVVRLVALLLVWFFTAPTLLLYLLLACLGDNR